MNRESWHGTLNGYKYHGCRCSECRAVRAESSRKYYEANRDRLTGWAREYRSANRDKVAERNRRYYEANRDKIAEANRRYYEANRDKMAERNRRYCEANRLAFGEVGPSARARRDGMNAAATRKGERWTSAEDVIVINNPAIMAAAMTGRGYYAVRNRRHRLHREGKM